MIVPAFLRSKVPRCFGVDMIDAPKREMFRNHLHVSSLQNNQNVQCVLLYEPGYGIEYFKEKVQYSVTTV